MILISSLKLSYDDQSHFQGLHHQELEAKSRKHKSDRLKTTFDSKMKTNKQSIMETQKKVERLDFDE